MEGIKP